MSNDFPAVPGDLELSEIVYSVTFPRAALGGAFVVDGVAAGMGGGLLNIGGTGTMQFAFTTPGSYGSFDQTAAETQIATILTDVCQLVADISGQTLADVQTGLPVSRQWTWLGADGSTATYTDLMPYPPAS